MTDYLAKLSLTYSEGLILVEACRALDDADRWRRRANACKDVNGAARAARIAIMMRREFDRTIAKLKEGATQWS
jgi:hypothetical protein